eukprot:scaffold51210_cov53-Cyclotella_meneghiniana.AAC.1
MDVAAIAGGVGAVGVGIGVVAVMPWCHRRVVLLAESGFRADFSKREFWGVPSGRQKFEA